MRNNERTEERNLRGNNGEDLEGQGRRRRGVQWQKQPQLHLVNIALNKCGAAWLKSWNSVVDASDLKMLQYYYENSAPFFKISFCLCSPVMRRSRWLKAPIIPSPPSFLPSLVTAPLLQPPAAQQPGLLSAINIPSLAGGNLSPNLCRLSLPSRRTSIHLTLRVESFLILVTLMCWLSSGPEGFCSIHLPFGTHKVDEIEFLSPIL